MELIKKVMEMRGMRRQEIVDYFKSLDNTVYEKDSFCGDGWRVEIGEEIIIGMRVFQVPSTTLIFSGDKEILDKIIYKFRLRFLTAGG